MSKKSEISFCVNIPQRPIKSQPTRHLKVTKFWIWNTEQHLWLFPGPTELFYKNILSFFCFNFTKSINITLSTSYKCFHFLLLRKNNILIEQIVTIFYKLFYLYIFYYTCCFMLLFIFPKIVNGKYLKLKTNFEFGVFKSRFLVCFLELCFA